MRRSETTLICAAGLLAGCSNETTPSAQAVAPTTRAAAVDIEQVPGNLSAMPQQLKADGWELVPSATYTAVQTQDGRVVITAKGEAPTGGYTVQLVQSVLKADPPQHLLYWKKPTGMAFQAITPFEVTASFPAAGGVQQVIVTDRAGSHVVPVQRAQ